MTKKKKPRFIAGVQVLDGTIIIKIDGLTHHVKFTDNVEIWEADGKINLISTVYNGRGGATAVTIKGERI